MHVHCWGASGWGCDLAPEKVCEASHHSWASHPCGSSDDVSINNALVIGCLEAFGASQCAFWHHSGIAGHFPALHHACGEKDLRSVAQSSDWLAAFDEAACALNDLRVSSKVLWGSTTWEVKGII